MDTEREWRRLQRAVRGAGSRARCFLVYDGVENRQAAGGRLAEELDATETVEIDHETTMSDLRRRVAEAPGNGPVQITDIERWSGGIEDLGEQLRVGLGRLGGESQRSVLIWAADAELSELLRAGGDLHGRTDRSFDLRADTRSREGGRDRWTCWKPSSRYAVGPIWCSRRRRGWGKTLSDMTLTKILRDTGLANRAAVHGFRSSFGTWASERTSVPHAVYEMALAHRIGSDVERSYSRSDLFEKRRGLMDMWAAYLAGGAKVLRLPAG